MKFFPLVIAIIVAPGFAAAACKEGLSTSELVSFDGSAPYHNFHGEHISHDPSTKNRSRFDFKSMGVRVELSALTSKEAIFLVSALGSEDKFRALQMGNTASVDLPAGTVNIKLDLIDPDARTNKRPDWVHVRFEACTK